MSEAHWGNGTGFAFVFDRGEVSQAVEAALAAEDECEQAKAWYAETIDNAEKAWTLVAQERRAGLTNATKGAKQND